MDVIVSEDKGGEKKKHRKDLNEWKLNIICLFVMEINCFAHRLKI